MGKAPANNNTKNVKIVVLLKYSSNFWRTLKIPLINCEISFDITWSENCVISSATRKTKFTINVKLYVPNVTLSTENNIKLLKQLESGLKKIIGINIKIN